ncbi:MULTISPECIES: NAD(P)/FAD-dependent oxidoreductase [unclassified Pseudomonas]|uniref:NAD(P)/FAD-dependent oxidoreductase n=1 Tax=unclassified Pseudomonas TaxID=196821 RepID=UPI0008767D84|nr:MULTISPECIES: FAD-dependent oxidoreductase [unclassified Pseudomonas]SCZ20794.1 3-phenylpropionate/trans-cinnamate dioxygenase ferredoxin reductase subunit [Pseudomonas sp. NFACC44-2]SDA43728.1 3-phenylpropionate/trans-cinnamate dioxygenase ferredoxin reductase subunit [Pseudomonas sp. NFACC51]SFH10303.1 3-phenylpropionate/trans-cinnamate dioxygenase ferredoxin reductase subunit [Pseudomonas sp. NFACC54]SFS43999.1 3-phenylpropionate/trans-cinnamate dioxygenase ferredoxin reductase subunit [P
MYPQNETAVIVGAGHAAAELVATLRQNGYPGRIILIGDEPELPYRRPPLSKTYLSGEASRESLLIRSAAAYDKLQVACWTGVQVCAIDRERRTVTLSDGRTQAYDKLVLATGGRPRRLEEPAAQKPNVHYIRNLADIERLQPDFVAGKRLLVIGGGYIGLEAASVGIKNGLQVTVLEAAPRVLARVAAPEISAFYEGVHRRRGVDVRTETSVQVFQGAERVESVQLSDGSELPVDLIIVGIGILPNDQLARDAGLEIDNGIVVDSYAQTLDPDILAVGDCARHVNGFLGCLIRIESVPSAQEQARTAAHTICGKNLPHIAVPWFWSDQFDLKLQIVGLSQGYDQLVLRGDMAAESFCAFYLRKGVVLSVDAVNRPQDFMVGKRLVAERVQVDPQVLADESVDLKSLLAAAL